MLGVMHDGKIIGKPWYLISKLLPKPIFVCCQSFPIENKQCWCNCWVIHQLLAATLKVRAEITEILSQIVCKCVFIRSLSTVVWKTHGPSECKLNKTDLCSLIQSFTISFKQKNKLWIWKKIFFNINIFLIFNIYPQNFL